jgi:flagellar motor switch protein FliG
LSKEAMATATSPPAQRVRQIAILVSSVDTAVARQLMLHLPTEMAKQVRGMLGRLGNVSPAERQAILSEFHKTAQGQSAPAGTPLPLTDSRSVSDFQPQPTKASVPLQPDPPAEAATELEPAPAWTRLSTPALVRFVRSERIAVAAVVISRLPPAKGVEVMRQLPREVHREILRRIAELQTVDPSAMTAIEEHLVERLSEYQQLIECEQANVRRLTALLAAAPPELQQEWQSVLSQPASSLDSSYEQTLVMTNREPEAPWAASAPVAGPVASISGLASRDPLAHQHESTAEIPVGKIPLVTTSRREMARATISELYGDAVITAAANFQSTPADDIRRADAQTAPHQLPVQSEAPPSTLSFTEALQSRRSAASLPARSTDEADKSGADLAPLLKLSSSTLALLLSSLDARTVLLALAGSSPAFMRRFSELLEPRDAKMLDERLQQMGSINLREVDEAQRRVMREAAPYLQTPSTIKRRAA